MEPNVNEGAPVDLTLLPVSNPLQHVLGSHICGGLEVEGNWTRNSFFISNAYGEHNSDWASTFYMNLKLSLTRRNWWRLLYLYVVAWIYEKWGYFCTLAALKLALLPEYNCQNKTPLVAAISGLYLVIGGQMASCLAGTGAITAWSHRSPPWCAYPRQ